MAIEYPSKQYVHITLPVKGCLQLENMNKMSYQSIHHQKIPHGITPEANGESVPVDKNWTVTSDRAVCHSTQRTRVQTLPEEITTASSATQFPIKGLHCFRRGLNLTPFPQKPLGGENWSVPPTILYSYLTLAPSLVKERAVQMRTIIGGGNGGTNLGHLFQFAADQFSDAGALLFAQHISFFKEYVVNTIIPSEIEFQGLSSGIEYELMNMMNIQDEVDERFSVWKENKRNNRINFLNVGGSMIWEDLI
ncbi:hypothetical protein LXL04_021226 [Taraxacum kok-saghyz]